MTTPNPEPCVDESQWNLRDDIVNPDGTLPAISSEGVPGWVNAREPRNNRRPYKADIRGLAEVELARAADEIMRLGTVECDLRKAVWDSQFRWAHALDQRNRWRIACLVVAVVGVVGWCL